VDRPRACTAGFHPDAIFAHKVIRTDVLADAMVRIGEYVAARGIAGDGSYRAARDLLLRAAPRVGGQPLLGPQEGSFQCPTARN
jgi:hypothetical protein